MTETRQINRFLVLSCLTGMLLSFYAYMVEMAAEEDHDYVAYCDISEHMSCTKAFSSEYGRGFGIIGKILGEDSILNQPNSLAGIFFYLTSAAISLSERKSMVKLLICLSAISNLLSLYLAYILYFILHDFCIVCVSTYIINAANLFLSIIKWKRITAKNDINSLKKKS